jgi:hypothetical protein
MDSKKRINTYVYTEDVILFELHGQAGQTDSIKFLVHRDGNKVLEGMKM